MNMKKCRVCGDQATGFNYDGLSCESCKVFFCRNSNKVKILKCEFWNNCLISISTRKKCPKCRLIKCLSIGMKRNRSSVNKNDQILPFFENRIQKGIEPLLEISILKFLSDFDLKSVTKYVSNQMDVQVQRKRLPLELTKFELEQISEAQSAICHVFRDERTVPIVKYVDSYDSNDESLTNTALMYIKKSINFCQHFAAFNSLNTRDQLVLMKSLCFDLLGLWFTFQLDRTIHGYALFTDESEKETMFVPNNVGESYQKHKELMDSMMVCGHALCDAMEDDVVIRDLLCATFLFKHTEKLSSPENIRYHYHLYSMLLLRYLQQKNQSKSEGNRKYLNLMRLLAQMEDFQKNKQAFAIEYGLEKIPPIMLELYDLV